VLSKTPPVFDDYKPPVGGGISGGGIGGDDGGDGEDFEAMLGLMKSGDGGGEAGEGAAAAEEDEGECGAWCKAAAVVGLYKL
jgi:hypothetical protein